MDKEIALKTLTRACLRLDAGGETRLDKNIAQSAFPVVADERPLETRIVEFLRATDQDAAFQCRPLPNGDFVVSRVSEQRVAITPTAASPPADPPKPAKPARRAPRKAAAAKPQPKPASAKPKQKKPKAEPARKSPSKLRRAARRSAVQAKRPGARAKKK